MKKKAVKHDQLCPFGGHTVEIFFGQVDLELLPFIAECVTNIENKPNLTLLSVFRLSDARACAKPRRCTAVYHNLICSIFR